MERRRASSPSRRKYRLLLRVYAAENLRHVSSQGTFCRVTIEEGETPSRGSARASLKRLLQGSARANALESSEDPLATLPPRIVTTKVQKSPHGKPVWNEKFELPVVDASHEVVHFRIKSARLMSAPAIGGASVMLSDVPTDSTMDRWINLFDNSRKPAGKLRIQMRLSLVTSASTPSSSPNTFSASSPSPFPRSRSSNTSYANAITPTNTTAEERDTYYQHPRRTTSSNISPTPMRSPLPRSNRRGAIIAPPIGGVATFRRSSTLSRSLLESRASGSTTASDSISSDNSHNHDSAVNPYTPSFNDSFIISESMSSPHTNKHDLPPTPTLRTPTPTIPTPTPTMPTAAIRDTGVSVASSRLTGLSGHDRSTGMSRATDFSVSSRDTELDFLASKYMVKPSRAPSVQIPEHIEPEPVATRKSSRESRQRTRETSMPVSEPLPVSTWESSWETPSPVGRASPMTFNQSSKEPPGVPRDPSMREDSYARKSSHSIYPDAPPSTLEPEPASTRESSWAASSPVSRRASPMTSRESLTESPVATRELTRPGRKKSTTAVPPQTLPLTIQPDPVNAWESSWETLSPRWSKPTTFQESPNAPKARESSMQETPKLSIPVPVPMPAVSLSSTLTPAAVPARKVPSPHVSKPTTSQRSVNEIPDAAVEERAMRELRTSQQILPHELEDFLNDDPLGEEAMEFADEQPVSVSSSPSGSPSSSASLSEIKLQTNSPRTQVTATASSSSAAAAKTIPSPKDERSPRTTNTTARSSDDDDDAELGETIEFDFDTGDVRPSTRLPSHMMRSTVTRLSIATSHIVSDDDASDDDKNDYDSDETDDEQEDDEMDPDGDPDGPRMVLRATVTRLLGRDSVNVIMDVDEEDDDDDEFDMDPFVFDELPLLDMHDTCFLIKDIDYADRTAAAS